MITRIIRDGPRLDERWLPDSGTVTVGDRQLRPSFLLDCPPGRTGPASVVEVAPGRPPLVHHFRSGTDALTWLLGEHEAALVLDAEIIDLVPAADGPGSIESPLATDPAELTAWIAAKTAGEGA